MKTKIFTRVSILLIAVFMLHSCDSLFTSLEDNSVNSAIEQPNESGEEEPEITESPLSIAVTVTREGAALSGGTFKINTIMETLELSTGSMKLDVADNEYPQVVWVTDENDNILLLSRGAFASDQSVEVNEETTALALITMAPVFTGVTKEEITSLETSIKETASYATYVAKVNELIASHKDMFDPSNKEVLDAIQSVIDEVLAKPKNAGTRSGSLVEDFDNDIVEPLKVRVGGNNVYVSVRAMYPSYEGRVYWGGSREKNSLNKMVNTTSSLGWLEYTKMAMGKTNYGEETTFELNDEGEYKFYFDKTTDQAIKDFSTRLVSDIFGLMGCDIIKEDVFNIVMTINSIVSDPSAYSSVSGFLESVGNAFISYGMSLDISQAKDASKGNKLRSRRYNIIGKSLLYYSVVKGGVGLVQRISLYYSPDTKDQIDFSLCYYNGKITSCKTTQVFKVSGDKQEGEESKKLSNPLVVKLESYNAESWEKTTNSDYIKVKFEVVSGGGSVTETYATIEPETNYARTSWYLGTIDAGEQKVKAIAYNTILKMTVGEPIFFTANIKGGDPTLSGNVVDLGLSVFWATCNLGASKPTEYGGYYAWGEITPKTFFTSDLQRVSDITNSFLSTFDLSGTEHDAAYVALGDHWRMPTKEDFKELIQNCTRETNVEIEGVKGDRYTASNGNSIFFPYGGSYSENLRNDKQIELWGVNEWGCYWSSSLGGDGYGLSPRFLNCWNGSGNPLVANQGWEGYNIRPVRSKP